jgi:hypothetical protein
MKPEDLKDCINKEEDYTLSNRRGFWWFHDLMNSFIFLNQPYKF